MLRSSSLQANEHCSSARGKTSRKKVIFSIKFRIFVFSEGRFLVHVSDVKSSTRLTYGIDLSFVDSN